jgi:hypothetical protein
MQPLSFPDAALLSHSSMGRVRSASTPLFSRTKTTTKISFFNRSLKAEKEGEDNLPDPSERQNRRIVSPAMCDASPESCKRNHSKLGKKNLTFR